MTETKPAAQDVPENGYNHNEMRVFEYIGEMNSLIIDACSPLPHDPANRVKWFGELSAEIEEAPWADINKMDGNTDVIKNFVRMFVPILASFPQNYFEETDGQNLSKSELDAWKACVGKLLEKNPSCAQTVFNAAATSMLAVKDEEFSETEAPIRYAYALLLADVANDTCNTDVIKDFVRVFVSPLVSFPQNYFEKTDGQNLSKSELDAWKACVGKLLEKNPSCAQTVFNAAATSMLAVKDEEFSETEAPIRYAYAFLLANAADDICIKDDPNADALSTLLFKSLPSEIKSNPYLLRRYVMSGEDYAKRVVSSFSDARLKHTDAHDYLLCALREFVALERKSPAVEYVLKEIVAYVKDDQEWKNIFIAIETISDILRMRPDLSLSPIIDPLANIDHYAPKLARGLKSFRFSLRDIRDDYADRVSPNRPCERKGRPAREVSLARRLHRDMKYKGLAVAFPTP